MFSMIDFFMTDCSANSHTMLDKLGVEEEWRLKCTVSGLMA